MTGPARSAVASSLLLLPAAQPCHALHPAGSLAAETPADTPAGQAATIGTGALLCCLLLIYLNRWVAFLLAFQAHNAVVQCSSHVCSMLLVECTISRAPNPDAARPEQPGELSPT